MATTHFDHLIVGSATEALDFIGSLLESLSEYSIVVQDLESKILLWNEGARRIYGYEAEEVLGTATAAILHTPEDISSGKLQEILRATLSTGKWEGILTRVRKDGQRFRAHMLWTLRRDAAGLPIGFLVISNDVSKEARLIRQAEHKFRGLLEAAPDAIVIVDRKGEIILANARTEKLFGYTQEELLHHSVDMLLPERLRARHEAHRQEFFRDPRVHRMGSGLELYGLRKDGSEFPADISLAPIETEEGVLLSSAIRDITDLKLMENLRAGEARILEMIATGARLEDTLAGLMRVIESQSQGMFCSVLLLDEDKVHVRHGAAPSLPPAYTKAVDGAPIGPKAGSCGTAMYLGKPVIVTDIFQDPLWADYSDFRNLLAPFRLRACWSTPIFSSKGDVLGSFAIYYREVRGPNAAERHLIDVATHIAGIAIEHKASQAALRASEERFSKAFHSSPTPMTISRFRDSTIVDINESLLRVLGYSREEIVGHTTVEIGMFDEQQQQLVRSLLHERGSVQDMEVKVRTKPGQSRMFVVSLAITHLGDEECVLGSLVDVSERKWVEEALRKSEEEYRRFFESSLAGNWVSAPNGEILACNPAFARIFGFQSVEEALQGNFASLYPTPEPRQRALDILRSQKRLEHYGLELRRRDGTPVHVIMNAIGSFDEHGNLVKVLGHLIDNTEKRKTEQQLLQAQKMEAVGRLAGGIAHDFNNILGVVMGFSDIVLEKMASTDPARSRIEEIRKAGTRAAALIRQLLAFSRRQVLYPAILNLNGIVNNLEEILQRLIGEDIKLAIVLDPALGLVRIDQSQIEQVILNLVINARDAMPNGGKLIVQTANVELNEQGAREHPPTQVGAYVMLAVSDTGMGMDAQTRAHIFEPFFSTKEVGKGTGLGLSTVYGIVKQSSGYIWVYSEPGRGTRFEIYLPRTQTTTEVSAPPLNSSSPHPVSSLRGSEVILLVEDAAPLRQLIQELLESAGYEVLHAGGPLEAIQTAEAHEGPIALLVTDVVMPDMSGPLLAERLVVRWPQMKVLYISGYAAGEARESGILSAKVTFLQKPFSKDELLRKVRETLDTAIPSQN